MTMMRSLLPLSISFLALTDARLLSKRSANDRKLLQLPNNRSACEIIEPLPEECSCHEPNKLSLQVECVKSFESVYLNDTIGLKMNLDPCDPDGASLSLDITEFEHNIDFPIERISAGEEKNLPLPGLSIHVPGIVNLGLDAAVLIEGNLDQLKLKVGINACAGVHTKQICASAIPGLKDRKSVV